MPQFTPLCGVYSIAMVQSAKKRDRDDLALCGWFLVAAQWRIAVKTLGARCSL